MCNADGCLKSLLLLYKIVVEFPEGWVGGYFSDQKKWKFQGGGGAYVKFPQWWEYGYFLELHVLLHTISNE